MDYGVNGSDGWLESIFLNEWLSLGLDDCFLEDGGSVVFVESSAWENINLISREAELLWLWEKYMESDDLFWRFRFWQLTPLIDDNLKGIDQLQRVS